MHKERGCIYKLLDPITDEVRYIGRTTMPLERRLREHLYHRAHSHKCHWVASLKERGLIPRIEMIEEYPYEELYERERYWIAYGRVQGWNLTNTTDGGEDGEQSPEVRERMSAIAKQRYADPLERERLVQRLHTTDSRPEVRRKRSESAKRRFQNPLEVERNRQYGIQRMQSLESRHRAGVKNIGKKMSESAVTVKADKLRELYASNAQKREQQRQSRLHYWETHPEMREFYKERMQNPELRALSGKANKGNNYHSKHYEGFVDPRGVMYSDIYNLAQFCIEHGLSKSKMCQVHSGQRKQHKGWTKLVV